ncbi:MAG: hypothetical protein WD638_14030 [Nitriliruptoraceae bacterium]
MNAPEGQIPADHYQSAATTSPFGEADSILLDNLDDELLRTAVKLVAGRAVTEASGGITPDRAAAVAGTGVDVISLGWLTHSAPRLDVAMDLLAGGAG